MTITDEQLQAIELRHAEDLRMLEINPELPKQYEGWESPGDIRDLWQAIRERESTIATLERAMTATETKLSQRDATIAELRRPWADIRKEFESEDGVDAVRAVDALCKRVNGHRKQVQRLERKIQVRDATICEMDEELEAIKKQLAELRNRLEAIGDKGWREYAEWVEQEWHSQLTELRKPVAVEPDEETEYVRYSLSRKYENRGGIPDHVLKDLAHLLRRCDTLAQDCARDASARDAMLAEMAGLRATFGKCTEYWQARFNVLTDAWNSGSNDAVLDACRKFIKANDDAPAQAKLEELAGLRERIEQMGRQAEQHAQYAAHRQRELEDTKERERQLRHVLWVLVEHNKLYFGWNHSTVIDGSAALAASPAPVESAALARPQPQGRTPEQYAIEHGRYLATAAREFMDACNAVWSAQQAVDEDETDTQNEADGLLNRLDEAKQSQCESWRALDNAIYEFTKRADRAYPLKRALAQPQGEQKQISGKRCTCDTSNGGSIPCYVESGGKLGELWHCAKAGQESGNV